jgi:glycosyltransferase involved in cell wall biosynthesis
MLDRVLIRWLVRHAGELVVFSDEARDGWMQVGAKSVRVIEHGADVATDESTSLPSQCDAVLCAGFLGPSKGIDVLLRAWTDVAPHTKLRLILAGQASEPWFGDVMAGYPELDNPPIILGRIDDESEFHELISQAAVVALPYRSSSPASGILVRALATGRAIVGTDVPAMRVITDGVDGLVVPREDHQALARALRRLSDSPDERDRLGASARRLAATRFTWNNHIRGIEAAYLAVRK